MKTWTTPLVLTAACLATTALFAQTTPATDKPANTTTTPGPFVDPARAAANADTVALPAVTVEGSSISAGLTPAHVTTEKGAASLARQRYLSGESNRALNAVTLPLAGRTPEERALTRMHEDQRLDALATIQARIDVVSLTDPAAAARLRTEANTLAVRDNAFASPLMLAADRR